MHVLVLIEVTLVHIVTFHFIDVLHLSHVKIQATLPIILVFGVVIIAHVHQAMPASIVKLTLDLVNRIHVFIKVHVISSSYSF